MANQNGPDKWRHQTSSVTDEITNGFGREILGGLFPPGATLLGEDRRRLTKAV
ncbi:hypothetical protein [Mesorhizobium sp. B4-1-3]|uniref:hypothetical protein n=1 Tax=Mesorhizobium sp. B4-1-3 TaxID=2589889 RepID=UPI0015E3AC4E|nr:hypothetical protein [Mesorhizobium sp. B4-1-3]